VKYVLILFFVIAIFTIGAYARLYWHSHRYGIGKKMEGRIDLIRLKFGDGQIFMINGVCYRVWLPYDELRRYERGMIVKHEPFWETTRGPKVLSTMLVSVKKKNKNATQTKSSSSVST
jgi:hypothetical protein